MDGWNGWINWWNRIGEWKEWVEGMGGWMDDGEFERHPGDNHLGEVYTIGSNYFRSTQHSGWQTASFKTVKQAKCVLDVEVELNYEGI